jgi:hypothetical protein
MKYPYKRTTAAFFASLFIISTTIAEVFDSTKVHDLKASELAGNMFGPSAFGQADVFVVQKAIVIPKNTKDAKTTVQLSKNCSVEMDSHKEISRIIKEGSAYGLFSKFEIETHKKTWRGIQTQRETSFMLSNMKYSVVSVPNIIWLHCKNIGRENSIGELKAALGGSFQIR